MAGLPPPYQPLFNYPNNKLYQYEAYPVLLSCNFVVDSTNGNGLGIRNLKGSGIANIFMNTSSSTGIGNYGAINPNPVAGAIQVQFSNNFNRYLGGFSGIIAPLTGTPVAVTALTAGRAYVITSLGTTTQAQWNTAGVPAGIQAVVGLAFIAKVASSGTGSTQQSTGSTIAVSPIGDPNAGLNNSNLYMNGGAQMILYCIDQSNGDLSAPADGSVIGLNFYLSNSSVAVNGQ